MKKNYIILLLSVAAFCSCQKETKKPVVSKLYPISFDLSAFSQTTGPITGSGTSRQKMSSSTLSLKDTIQSLYYLIVNTADNKVIRIQTQRATDSSFGILKDSVPAGNYKVVLFAGNYPLAMRSRFPLAADLSQAKPLINMKFIMMLARYTVANLITVSGATYYINH